LARFNIFHWALFDFQGIYIKPDDETVPNRFRGIGIRIEDDVVITDTGYEVLSAKSPKKIEEIENLIKTKA
jgi:Xaa-Pro aminopeptidase